MTIKRLILFFFLTPIAILLSVSSLFGSLQEPQFQSRLELYQTNIALQAQAYKPQDNDEDNFSAVKTAIVGDQPLETATQQYQQARELVKTNLDKAQKKLAQSQTIPLPPKPLPNAPPETNPSPEQKQKNLQQSIKELENLLAELDLRLGILQAKQGNTDVAMNIWGELEQRPQIKPELRETAAVLMGIWSVTPRLLPNAQQLINKNLDGWFSSTSLIELYELQQRQEAISKLKAEQQEAAGEAVMKLAIIATIPTFTALIGFILLVFLIGQRWLKGKAALLAQNADLPWSTPWGAEAILQVFVVGFFFMGQIFVPVLIFLLPIPRPIVDVRLQALSVLVSYIMVASGALLVLYLSIKRFFPLPENWFRFRYQGAWLWWGLGGYCAALPIVVLVSLINQQLWQGQGGSNPLLQLALEGQDTVALAMFFFTAAIAAPIFEELLFRGFLLPSLTRYISVWGAIILSSLLFAIAHLSLSEILPLTALGIVLGIVYTRSRNLLAPMLLHSLWNSGTLLSLFILGSGN
ncbi:CPBP family intramembrane glutamic endopeptidase [Umezakia ovalisporum]|jgi:membrane protease YdiL (CAAX protease family)|uniref:CPBP family intramembrane metalloprotease n=1 Tax=Umezakia ovalisporum FSS-43 TaxID=2740520 RepID=A0ABT6K2D8_9CYAN|nr:type II CAAX endopeptidase family protein [Umezakia ovalisporum]MBI1241781.1 CPBP family intramembrane metalloprotease [Nostoc sp. RI_552]MDH6056454.1 CPBP family intramembrane metalloprotease [Umezakia ovalisporum FSS-43]MDH6066771.1 CPBP family intramembrane metalloprotease [Umezakia ovalisporum APH033B]MDH6072666.1 CPBP family intramembrane metalloprotease [Umezakia ovalisporum CobakiLakeA]MDH6075642.1 CPBP family intramembrane metalloprotease [Umezakia ovalisporum CS-1034]